MSSSKILVEAIFEDKDGVIYSEQLEILISFTEEDRRAWRAISAESDYISMDDLDQFIDHIRRNVDAAATPIIEREYPGRSLVDFFDIRIPRNALTFPTTSSEKD